MAIRPRTRCARSVHAILNVYANSRLLPTSLRHIPSTNQPPPNTPPSLQNTHKETSSPLAHRSPHSTTASPSPWTVTTNRNPSTRSTTCNRHGGRSTEGRIMGRLRRVCMRRGRRGGRSVGAGRRWRSSSMAGCRILSFEKKCERMWEKKGNKEVKKERI